MITVVLSLNECQSLSESNSKSHLALHFLGYFSFFLFLAGIVDVVLVKAEPINTTEADGMSVMTLGSQENK